ncbi:hypothetical protein QE391_002408 [Pseudomonas fluorescens]|nr:hypothetical protein [Pseudomonas fluorescens]
MCRNFGYQPDLSFAPLSCRSEPARDSGMSVANDLPEQPPSRAGSLLQVLRRNANSGQPTNPPVGVSLLAIAVCQSLMFCLNRRLREQAHSYRFGVGPSLRAIHEFHVGASLLAKPTPRTRQIPNCARSCAVGRNISGPKSSAAQALQGLQPSAQEVAQYCATSCALSSDYSAENRPER